MTTPFDLWIWKTRDKRECAVGEMPRDHVRNALQWCMRERQSYTWDENGNTYTEFVQKDHHTFPEWITAFTVKLLDQDLPE